MISVDESIKIEGKVTAVPVDEANERPQEASEACSMHIRGEQSLKIIIGHDHAAFDEGKRLTLYLKQKGHTVFEVGTHSSEKCHYPSFAIALSKLVVLEKAGSRGILLCGSGIGMAIVANRFKGIQAALCRSEEDAQLSRRHNNTNVLCLGARITPFEDIVKITDIWLSTDYEGGRHSKRLALFEHLGEEV